MEIKLTIERTDENAIQVLNWLDGWLIAENEYIRGPRLDETCERRHALAASILTTLIERAHKEISNGF